VSDRPVERSTAAEADAAPPAAARRGEAPVGGQVASDTPRAVPEPAAADAPADELTLPSAEALAAQGIALPTLRLELHAYSAKPADRFVFINGTKYLEGATLAEGPRLLKIAPNGAVLVYLGRRFLLAAQQ
jgi:general secretion pathway protein B